MTQLRIINEHVVDLSKHSPAQVEAINAVQEAEQKMQKYFAQVEKYQLQINLTTPNLENDKHLNKLKRLQQTAKNYYDFWKHKHQRLQASQQQLFRNIEKINKEILQNKIACTH